MTLSIFRSNFVQVHLLRLRALLSLRLVPKIDLSLIYVGKNAGLPKSILSIDALQERRFYSKRLLYIARTKDKVARQLMTFFRLTVTNGISHMISQHIHVMCMKNDIPCAPVI